MKILSTATALALTLAFTGCTRDSTDTTGTLSDDSTVAPAPVTPGNPDGTSVGDNRTDIDPPTASNDPNNADDQTGTTGASRMGNDSTNATGNHSNMHDDDADLGPSDRTVTQPPPVSPGSENPAR